MSYRSFFINSSINILSASCNSLTFSSVTSSITLIPKPGPGNGCLFINSSRSPKFLPSLLTSSLNKFLKGSINSNLQSFGKPPTLWCDLIVCDKPSSLADSITSGYIVPCAKNLISFSSCNFLACSLNTSMNSLPIIFLFFFRFYYTF